MNKTVVIPAAGLGSRLSEFTKNYSKAMCTLGPKPIISYIIEKFDNNDEIIVLLGYKGDLLRQVVTACYPEYNIKFVEVDNYDGPGSGLGHSLSCAKDLLQKPFIFWSCDTVLEDINVNELPYDKNWMIYGQCESSLFFEYRHLKVKENKVIDILPKDLNCLYINVPNDVFPYVGVSFIHDYENFWEAYNTNKDGFIKSGEVLGLVNLSNIIGIRTREWLDMGNKSLFEKYKKIYNDNMDATILEKPDEAIWFVNNKVIKFHINEKFISDRVKRWNTILCKQQLDNNIRLPHLVSYTKNTYTYDMAPGVIASKVITVPMLIEILTNYFDVNIEELSPEEKLNIYNDFYLKKTLSRINKYCTEYADIDKEIFINGIACYPATELVNKINWERLAANGIFTYNYHGDFHLENILVDDGTYIMLDFRQNFGKSEIGDMYYDIAKMWHSFIVNHTMVKDELFEVKNINENHVMIDIHRTFIDCECEKALIEWLDRSKLYDRNMSELMTCIIFLNIAACHIYPYSKFLFYLGKLMINMFYQKHKEFFKN